MSVLRKNKTESETNTNTMTVTDEGLILREAAAVLGHTVHIFVALLARTRWTLRRELTGFKKIFI